MYDSYIIIYHFWFAGENQRPFLNRLYTGGHDYINAVYTKVPVMHNNLQIYLIYLFNLFVLLVCHT